MSLTPTLNLDCPNCMSYYDRQLRHPKILQCSQNHIICLQCVNRNYNPDTWTLQCPIDNETFQCQIGELQTVFRILKDLNDLSPQIDQSLQSQVDQIFLNIEIQKDISEQLIKQAKEIQLCLQQEVQTLTNQIKKQFQQLISTIKQKVEAKTQEIFRIHTQKQMELNQIIFSEKKLIQKYSNAKKSELDNIQKTQAFIQEFSQMQREQERRNLKLVCRTNDQAFQEIIESFQNLFELKFDLVVESESNEQDLNQNKLVLKIIRLMNEFPTNFKANQQFAITQKSLQDSLNYEKENCFIGGRAISGQRNQNLDLKFHEGDSKVDNPQFKIFNRLGNYWLADYGTQNYLSIKCSNIKPIELQPGQIFIFADFVCELEVLECFNGNKTQVHPDRILQNIAGIY